MLKTKLHIVSFTLLMILIVGLSVNGTVYAAIASDVPQEAATVEPIESPDIGDAAEAPAEEEEATLESSELSGGTSSAMSGGEEGGAEATQSSFSVKPLQISPAGNSGAAVTSIPIVVPAGRKGIQPNLSLNYSSSAKNGWIGVGWNLDMGAIQRNTKRGIDYDADDYVAAMSGSASELVPRDNDWGPGYYSAKIEGAFSKYQYISSDDRWEVTSKDGTKYFYGKDPITQYEARQDDPNDSSSVFKWCLVRVQDTNGNYMTVSYTKDQGQIYLDRIEYTGNGVLTPSNYVQFYLEDRDDITVKYVPGFKVITEKRLKTIEVSTGQYPNGIIIRAYNLTYDADQSTTGIYEYSPGTGRSLLGSVQMFGNDVSIDQDGIVTGGSSQPATVFAWQYRLADFTTAEDVTNIYGEGFWDHVKPISGDFNGDGCTDIILDGSDVSLLTADCTGDFTVDDITSSHWSAGIAFTGDFNSDGNADIILQGSTDDHTTFLLMADGTGGFTVDDITTDYGMSSEHWAAENRRLVTGDFNGDGRTDILLQGAHENAGTFLLIADATGGFIPVDDITNDYGMNVGRWAAENRRLATGDFNGDGRTDIILQGQRGGVKTFLLITDEVDGVNGFTVSDITSQYEMGLNYWVADQRNLATGDFNGDGRTDIILQGRDITRATYLLIANGAGGFRSVDDITSNYEMSFDLWHDSALVPGDFNGDGSTDILLHGDRNEETYLLIANGTGGFNTVENITNSYGMNIEYWSKDHRGRVIGDFNGDGSTDILVRRDKNHGKTFLIISDESFVDLVDSVSNGLGGSTILEYEYSSSYENKLLPFVVNTLSKVTINDGNGNDTITEYDYAGGNFDYADRSFWGFDYVKAVSLYNYDEGNGLCSENSDYDCTVSETWFNNEDFEFKGLPLEQITSSAGATYTRSENTYDFTVPYTDVSFTRLIQKDDEVFDGTDTPKAVSTLFEYDIYGNITKKSFLGEGEPVTGDERYEYTVYSPYDTTNWIVSLPKHMYVKDEDDNAILAQQWFTYDTNGNMLTKKAWLDGGTDPVTTYTYDSYGNIETITDPNDNPPTTITYDTATHTFSVAMQNHLLQTTTKTYHSIFIDKVETETGPNGNTTTYRYDEFGRILKVIGPKDSDTYPTMTYEYPLYADYGQIGTQEVTTCAAEKHAAEQPGSEDYLCGETYFDGLGRTIMTRSNGPDSKTIVTETLYGDRGLTISESLPYFEGDAVRWTDYEYDPIGRVIKATFPDTTYSTSEYLRGTLTFIDPNGHKKVEKKDVYGRLIKVEEYFGDGSTENPHVLYATTTYEYDVLGNLRFVTDAENNITEIMYDTLSRKNWMDDPDMGVWEYDYDANGNLVWQKDAKLQEIIFEYDALNRIEKSIYIDPVNSNPYIEYFYDEYDGGSNTNAIGRLTKSIDFSGTTKYYYDELGQTVKTIKTIDLTDYMTETTYDALGRTESLKYPDNTIVKYEYGTGGNLEKVTDATSSFIYAEYTGYNALGQYEQVAFNNGVTTTYQYRADNNRLDSILTANTESSLISLTYEYDNVGNITGITDSVDSLRTRTYTYDELDRLIEVNSSSYGGNLVYQYDEIGNITKNCKYGDYFYEDPDHKHAVTKVKKSDGTVQAEYQYDANGNMKSGAGRTFSYDYDNRPTSIATDGAATISVYDAGGQRVKKDFPGSSTVYVGKLYECTNGVCTKYIFGGSQRIAKIDSAETYYYHSDHLGSSSVVTDSSANKAQGLYYYPYGEIKINSESDIAKHKFTGQEWDAETGLYYYNARYYDPKLARFISADTIVPEPGNPQALNRYSYVVNNPVKYIDPSGHGFFSSLWKSIKNIIKPIIAVAVAVAAYYIIGPLATGLVEGLVGCAGYCTAAAYYSSAVVGGAIAGAAAGAASTAVMGGDIGQGALIGAISGGIGSFVGSLGISNTYMKGLAQIGSGGVSGGIASDISGGKFSEGFMYGAISAGASMSARYLYKKLVRYDLTAESGGAAVEKKILDSPCKGCNNIGTQGKALNPNGWFNEGGRVSRFFNRIPGVNAVGGMHDVFQVNIDRGLGNFARSVLNVPGMIPAAAITYSGFTTGPNAAILIPAYRRK